MAWRKIIRYIFIPFLAFLLMSHNTYAAELQLPVRLRSVYSTTFSSTGPDHSYWGQQYGYGPMQSTMFRLNWPNLTCEAGDYLETIVNFFNTENNNSLDAWVSSLYGGDSDFSFITATYENMDSSSGQIKFVIYCNTTFTNANKFLEFGSATGAKLNIYTNEYLTVIYTTRYTVVDPNAGTQDIVNAINNHAAPSAEDIADAVNAPEEEAASNIENQDTSDIDTGDTSSALSIIGNIQNITGIIQDAPLKENCIINANFGNLNLGGLNLCSGRENLASVADFGNAVFALTTTLAGSIYLIRKTLKLIDWARGD